MEGIPITPVDRGMSHAPCFLCKLLMGKMLTKPLGYVLSHSQFLQHVSHRDWTGVPKLVVSSMEPRSCALEELGPGP